jgi:integrase
MPKMKLTAQGIPGLKPKDATREQVYRDTVVRGLLLEVHPSGKRTFVAWTRVKGSGRAVRVTLGHWAPGVFELADARTKAREVLHDAAHGKDPVAERKRAKAAGTFGDMADNYLKDAKSSLRPTTFAGWGYLLRHPRLAPLRAMRTLDITRSDIIRLLAKIRKTSLENGGKGLSANRTFEAVRRVFSWAVQSDLVPASPCFGVIKPTQKEQRRQRRYTDEELGRIVRALNGTPMDSAIRLCLYTGVRMAQALGAPWHEFALPLKHNGEPDIAKSSWSISGERAGTKNALPWLVPLPAPAIALLAARARIGEYVFSSRSRDNTREIATRRSQKAVYRIRKASGIDDFTPHDFRRTLNSWLASAAGGAVSLEIRDAILGHAKPGLEGTYNVHEYAAEKRTALDRWARHVERVAKAEGKGKVLAMPGVA